MVERQCQLTAGIHRWPREISDLLARVAAGGQPEPGTDITGDAELEQLFKTMVREMQAAHNGSAEPTERSKNNSAILSAIREVGQLIVQETDRTSLFSDACDLLATPREVHDAWIGVLDSTGKIEEGEMVQAGLKGAATSFREYLAAGHWPTYAKQALATGSAAGFEFATHGRSPVSGRDQGQPKSQADPHHVLDDVRGRGGQPANLQPPHKLLHYQSGGFGPVRLGGPVGEKYLANRRSSAARTSEVRNRMID